MFQFRNAGRSPTAIVYDSDFGASIDTVLALALLHGLEGKTEARIASLTIGNTNLQSAQLCDVVEKFYAGTPTGLAATFAVVTPIGLATNGKGTDSTMAQVVLAKHDVYSPRIHKLNDTAIPEVLIRNALTAQSDGKAVVVLAGPATNLAKLLDIKGAPELIETKVKFLVLARGSFSGSAPDPSVAADIPALKRVLAEWPSPIIAAGREIGAAVSYPGASIETDFAYAPNHPVAAAYRAYRPMPYDAPATAMAAVLYAAHPNEGYFKLTPPGVISVAPDGHTTFQESAAGKQRCLIPDPTRHDEILKLFTTLASAKPVVRSFRGAAAAAAAAADEEIKKDPAAKP